MAWENIGWVWNVAGVQGSEYVVLIYLADQANGKGITPILPVEKIMRRCNLSRTSVFLYLKHLETKGFMSRNRQYAAAGDFAANTYTLDVTRFFPKEYEDAKEMWQKILQFLGENPGRVSPHDLKVLHLVREVFHQRNSKVLCLVTEVDDYEEFLMRNLPQLKNASVSLKLPIRRFEVFRRPRLT